MTTEGSGSPADDFEVRRDADARPEIDQFREDTQPVVLKSVRTGATLSPRVVSGLRDPNTGQIKHYKPPMLTAEEQSQAVAALRQAMEQNTTRYPQLAQHMLTQPEDIWLLPELTLMFDAQPDQVTADLVGELSSSLTTTTQDIENYNQNLHASKTQELFWNDVGNLYDSDIRDLLLHQMAQLDPSGADRVGALALAWRDNHDMADEENQMQLLLNIHQWSYSEDQALADKEQGGFWGGFFEKLDAGQEFVESGVSSLITQGQSVLSSPEEAARRQHLTLGQKLAYMAGLRPPDEAGDWGWWRAVSGGTDAISEIGLDPLNLLAGAGAGVKAVKTIPMASKATAAGRIGMGLRSQLPRFFSGSTRNIRGGRWARLTYALRSKTVDDLLDTTVKNGVADEALRIIKADNQAALQRTFPQWGRMSDEMYRVIQENVETPEEFVQVLKAGALDEVLNSGRTLDELEMATEEAWTAARRYVDDAGTGPLRLLPEEDQLARKARSNWNYTAESLRPAVRTILEGGDIADDALRQRADALIKWWRVKAETPGGLKRALNADEIATWTNLDQGDEFFMDMASSDIGGVFAAGARKGEGGGWVMEFSDDTKGALNELNQIEAARGGDEWLVSGYFQVDELDEANKIIRVSPTREVGEQLPRTLDDLLVDQRIPRDVRLNAARAQLSLDAHNAKTSVPFIISDIPTKPRKVFRWTDRFQGKGRGSLAARRILARATPGRPPDEIELFNTRRATAQLDSLFRHFGMREEVVDDLINEFRSLDLGARQDWFWDRAMRELGSEIGVPAFQHNLIQFYKGGGVRKFAGSGSDLWTDVTGKAHRMPILSSQFTTKMPLPLDEMMEVSRRARTIGERSTIAKALGWNGRGLGATKSRRVELVNRLRTQLGDEAADMADEELWNMAYSAVNPAAGMDGRGWWSGFLMPKAGSAFNNLHRKFTKLMLVTRPIQWMWRVALLEEPIRAHMYNMPSLYSNPLQYMGAAREAHLIENVSKWAQANSDFGHDVYRTLTAGADRGTLVNRLSENGILDDILDGRKVDDVPLPELRAGVSSFIDDALHSRTRINKLNPIKKVGWAVKKRTRKIEKAENALRRMGLPESFTFVDDTTINQKLVSGYLGEEVGVSDGNKIYQWSEAMTDTEAYMHGQVWGSKLVEIAEDPLARKALHAKATRLTGAPTTSLGGLTRDELLETGDVLYRGSTRTEDGVRGGRAYFTEDPQVASRFAESGIPTKSLDEVLDIDAVDDLDPSDVEYLFRGGSGVQVSFGGVDDAGELVFRNVGGADELVDLARQSDVSFLDEVVVRQLRPDRAPQVTRTTVYGQSLDLTGVLREDQLPEGLIDALRQDRLVEKVSYGTMVRASDGTFQRHTGPDALRFVDWRQHEKASFENTAEWMRKHGYGKIRVPDDPNVSGPVSIIAIEDFIGPKALDAAERGTTNATNVADAVVNSSRWELLRHDMQLRFPNVEDELQLAQRYIDDVVMPEVDHLFRPFLDNLEPEEAAELLDEFARTRRITTELYGEAVDFDLRGANYAGGVRSVGDFTASMRGRANAVIPSDLPATTFDPRFMAHDDAGWVKRFTDWTLQTFGERATQALNRRPAWIREFERWNGHYSKLGVPEEVAKRMATDHANQMVNYVFFQMDEAPYYAAKMNQYFPFAGATYEVLGAWSYKMPVAVGGTWPTGIGEFTRKFDRLMDGLVNTGLVSRGEEEDGSLTYTLNLVPPDSSAASNNELGRFLQGAGFKMVNTLDQVISTVFGLEEGLDLRSQGYRLAVGHPLNPEDFGVLSFAQANLGLNPQSNLAATLAGRFLGAGAPERTSIGAGGESLADTVDRLEIDINELVRYNREIFVDTEGFGSSDLYNGILAGVVDPEELVLPEGTILNVPDTSFWDGFIKDTFQPFGDIDSFQEFGINFLPGTMRWALAGLALQNQPSDEFWSDTDLEGIFGGMLPSINEAQVSSQLNEAFMYLEAHDIVGGKGPFARIQEKEERLQSLLDSGNEEAANKLKREIEVDTEAFLGRAQKVAAESLILRSFTGQFLPTSPGHVRKEQELIQQYWDTLEYSDSIRVGKGEAPRLANFGSIEELENYYEQLSAWLEDPTGDRARATFRKNYPQLQAYLTPKTFYSEPVPDITSYEEYQNQIESGEREPAPLHVTMWRARSSAIQADFYNKYIAQFGNDPHEAAANALNQRTEWQGLNDERNQAYQALEMWDDMHGGVYNQWRDDNYEPENWAQDAITEKLNTIRDNLGIVLELEDTFDVTLDLQGIEGLNTALRASIAEISNAIRDYTDFTENTDNRNAYEQAINQYFEEIYIPYQEQISALYDRLPEVADSERQSIIYERIKDLKNQYANSTVFLNDNLEVPFPNPLEYSWTGKEPEEQTIKVQQWLTRPIEWMDQDQTIRITERASHMARYLPVNDGDFDIYQDATLAKVTVDEMFEADEITRSERTKLIKNIEAQVRAGLIAMDRAGEVEFMDMTPFEKLELAGELPAELGIYGDAVRYYKEVLEVTEESAGTIRGRQIVAPLYDEVETAFFSDPTMRQTIQELGINIQDEDTLDNFLPFLFFGYTGER